ncbi:uncharacterized protein LOC121427676 [Lytechinus variegatus]|uniref:uncharacterized protein LOC121427676 n=1 Tax=Lytechinus variegatus TaxID=7654 RepID=UPI001BB1B20C|nr:uncharacterized protein LOC121427676 [Lytechinus variegatus]
MALWGTISLSFFVILLHVTLGEHQRIECPKKSGKSAHFYALANTAMEIAYTEELNVTVFECSRRCRDDGGCMSYGYSKRLESCQLYDFDRETGPEFLVTSSDYVYYDTVDTKTSNPHYMGSCKHHQCEHGVCRMDCSNRGYYCECAEGYRGEFCQSAYIHEPRLVDEIITDRARDGVGFTFNNMNFLAISSLHTQDSAGNNAQADQVILRYDYSTEQYEPMQILTGISVAYFLTEFQLTGKQYLFICNYREFGDTQDTDSYLWVYDNSSDSFIVHQTFDTKGCLAPAKIRASDSGFYLFLGFYYAPSSYDQESPVFKWYPRYERFVEVDTVSTTGVYKSSMFEIDGTVYVGLSSFRSSSGFQNSAEVWERTDTYDLYRGCYVDGTNRALDGDSFSSSSMTVTMCITYCRDLGYPYVGLQAQSHCFCGDENYDEHGSVSDGDCNQQCAGDSSEYCGASWRNSIYMTEPSWSQTQVLPDSNPGSMDIEYYSHEESHYIVLSRHHDGSECDQDTEVYIWNAGLKEFETHQTISFSETCSLGIEVFERGGEKFMLTSNARKFYSATEPDHWAVNCRIFRLVDTVWIDHTTVSGFNVVNFQTFERDGELYIFQTGGRNETNPGSTYSECTQKIYQWI